MNPDRTAPLIGVHIVYNEGHHSKITDEREMTIVVNGNNRVKYVLQIIFEGVVGQSWQGDIALDDIAMTLSPCPPASEYFYFYCTLYSNTPRL